jgi:hypothetical protein
MPHQLIHPSKSFEIRAVRQLTLVLPAMFLQMTPRQHDQKYERVLKVLHEHTGRRNCVETRPMNRHQQHLLWYRSGRKGRHADQSPAAKVKQEAVRLRHATRLHLSRLQKHRRNSDPRQSLTRSIVESDAHQLEGDQNWVHGASLLKHEVLETLAYIQYKVWHLEKRGNVRRARQQMLGHHPTGAICPSYRFEHVATPVKSICGWVSLQQCAVGLKADAHFSMEYFSCKISSGVRSDKPSSSSSSCTLELT